MFIVLLKAIFKIKHGIGIVAPPIQNKHMWVYVEKSK